MNNPILVAMLLLLASSSACAYTDTGGHFTSGPDGYSEYDFFLESGNDDYYLSPTLTTYKSDFIDRRYTYSLEAGLDRPFWRASAAASSTPNADGYKNTALYADLSVNLLKGQGERTALEDLTLGTFGDITLHESDYALSTATLSSGRVESLSTSATASAVKLTQTDYGLKASVRVHGVRISGSLTRTVYNKDIPALDIRLPLGTDGTGGGAYRDKVVSLRARVPSLPLSPECGYMKTYFLLTQPDSESVNFGISQKIKAVEFSADWERFNPGGGASKSDYYSLGAVFSF